jgi:thiol-disulfide isomerase/thioredoxin
MLLTGSPLAAQRVGTQLPGDFAVATLPGQILPWSEATGGVRVVNLWASWCPPCRAELPSLGVLARALAPDGITVVALALDRPGAVHRFLATVPEPPPVLVEHEPLPRAWGRWALPVTLILGADDRVLHTHFGAARWDDPAVIAAVRALARQGSTAR